MRATAKVIGGANLARTFAKMEQAARGQVLEAALASGGFLIANAAKNNAPVLTGNLRRSIHVSGDTPAARSSRAEMGSSEASDLARSGKTWSGSTGTDIGGASSSPNHAAVIVGTNVEYARFLEEGTSRMAAQPFMQPALDETKTAALAEVKRALKILVQKAPK